jgi:hypothetical protein
LFFVLFVAREECPIVEPFYFECAMSFKVEDLGLEVICRDHLKEDDEGI